MGKTPPNEQRARDLAWAEALTGAARVLATLGARLRDLHEPPAATDKAGAAPSSTKPARLPRSGLGPRQLAVLALRGLDSEYGLAASEVAIALSYSASNAHTVLASLEKTGQLERLPNERPIRWRRTETPG